jgi:hypothetical protein
VIQRGDLLSMAKRLGQSLWPTEIPQVHLLLEMLVEEGTSMYPFERANLMLSEMLGLEFGPKPHWSAAEIRRRITSAALLVALSLKNFEAKGNHFASVVAWVQFCAAAIGACERFRVSFDNNASASVDLAQTAIRDALVDLAKEVLERDVLVEGNMVADAAFYRARVTLLLGSLSLLWFWCESEGWPPDLSKQDLEEFLNEGKSQLFLWGEAAIPQILAYYWFLRRTDSRAAVDAMLVQMIAATVASQGDEPVGLPSPYWNFEDIARHTLVPILGSDQDPLRKESTGRFSYYAESLFHLLVRMNWKNQCRTFWPDLTRIQFIQFNPRTQWQYCLSFSEEGEYRQVQPPFRKEWQALMEDASSVRDDSAPHPLSERPLLHALFVLLFPYRGTPDVIRSLSYQFIRTWLISVPPRT